MRKINLMAEENICLLKWELTDDLVSGMDDTRRVIDYDIQHPKGELVAVEPQGESFVAYFRVNPDAGTQVTRIRATCTRRRGAVGRYIKTHMLGYNGSVVWHFFEVPIPTSELN